MCFFPLFFLPVRLAAPHLPAVGQPLPQHPPLRGPHVPVAEVAQPAEARAAGHQQVGRRGGQVVHTAQDKELLLGSEGGGGGGGGGGG